MSAELNPAQSALPPQAQWFLARDGQQFGPLSDQELRKLVEMGHLKPSDLLWREGFPEWRSARILLPEAGAPPKLVLGGAAPVATAPVMAAETTATPTAAPAPEPAPVPAAPVPAAPVQAVPVQAAPVQPAVTQPVAAPTGVQPIATSAAVSQPAPSGPQPQSAAAPVQAQARAPAATPLAQPQTSQPSVAQPSLAQRAAAAAQATLAQSTMPGPAPVAAAPAAYAPAQPHAIAQPQAAQVQARAPATAPVRPQTGLTAQPTPSRGPVPAPQRPLASPPGPAVQQPMPQLGPAGYAAPSAPIANPRAAEPPKAAPRLGPQTAPQRGRSAAPIAGPEFEDDDYDVPRAGIGRWIARIAIAVFFLATLSAAGLYAYPHRDSIAAFAKGLIPTSLTAAPAKSPLSGFAPSVEATDVALQGAPLWQVLKREFPDWYGDRVKEASSLAREQKSETQIAAQMMSQVMALRRKHAGDALSATSSKLKSVATSLAENLVRLRSTSVEACHGFITAGETHAAYLKVLGDPKHTAALQAQLTSVFEAVADGRKVPRVYPQPKQTDYNTVVGLLEKRGWTNTDMRLFSDSGSFAKTEPDKMCKMVIDWFQAQLEVTDSETQLRLLSDALKPVIAG